MTPEIQDRHKTYKKYTQYFICKREKRYHTASKVRIFMCLISLIYQEQVYNIVYNFKHAQNAQSKT